MTDTAKSGKGKFVQGLGGRIHGPQCEVVCTVAVEDLRLDEAQRAITAIIKALEEEFPG